MMITIGENIKRMRNQKSVTQEKLAESIGVTAQAISRWESGTGYPAIEYLPELAGFFGISVDELLGVKLSEREVRREEIYSTISNIEECGYNPTAFNLLREYHAEFPSDMKIRLALARALCSEMWEETPDQASLREAEKMLRDMIKQSDDYDFRFTCVKELAVLYKEAWKDEQGYDEVVSMLPSLDSCREIFITDCFNGTIQKKEEIEDCILSLIRHTVNVLRDYVAFTLPNEQENWDTKLSYFKCMVEFCEKVSGMVEPDKAAALEGPMAMLYRYMATYYVAMNKKEETLDCLEKMLQHVEKGRCADPSVPHNLAWYYLPYLDQERYDPVRKSKRFKAVKEKLASIAK